MNFMPLFKNKLDRIKYKKEIFVVALIIIPITILATILLSNRQELRSNIALVTQDAQSVQEFPENNKFTIIPVKEKPTLSNLILGYYDAIVEKNNEGTYLVMTVIKSKKDTDIISNYFNKKESPVDYESQDLERGVGTKVLGFIIMIILMQGVAITMLYTEDRTLRTFGRIMMAPVSEQLYIASQGIFTFICLYFPTYLALVITKEVFGVELGFGLGLLALLIGMVTALGTAFGLFMSSILKQNVSLTASLFAIITSLLGTCLVPFKVNNSVIDGMISLIPQKAFMEILEGAEKGKELLQFKGQLIDLAVWILVLWFFGSYVIQRKVSSGNY
ncbi:ABC-2 type transport system permease protein [Paenibacillus tianmuensis]|uniref:ABC-2 type transport system permease protein n=1 Tax=Paenibacillus tianmuensis TaxID=624147 RepID=A0A1G4R029_9BACL|nr:ABC transporter permease [Paenibacillus tianmuensis]SCW50028.1 ABC-2 type transport system permease protein [Paenibacillus tianmuensis]